MNKVQIIKITVYDDVSCKTVETIEPKDKIIQKDELSEFKRQFLKGCKPDHKIFLTLKNLEK